MSAKLKTALILTVLMVLAGCGSSSGAPAPALSTLTPARLAVELKTAVPQVVKIIQITQTNDPNTLLGRPNGYNAATVLIDKRGDCSNGPGSDCGAMIEQWGSPSDVRARAQYIQGILKASPTLGSEYDFARGDLLLRVTGKLTPSQAAAYNAVFKGQGPLGAN